MEIIASYSKFLESFTYRGLAAQPQHDSGCTNDDVNTLSESGFKWDSKRKCFICDVDTNTIVSIKYKTDLMLFKWRIEQNKKVLGDWDEQKKITNGKTSEKNVNDCLSQIKRFLIDNMLIEA